MQRESTKVPCREACPAGVDVPRYLRLIVASRYTEALAVIRESIPFPAVCGYVCPGPCQVQCHLAHLADAPEAIRILKRFVADRASGTGEQSHQSPPTGKRVAIVGSGPAGLTAAYYLARQGHKPAVFEALPEPGGMMRMGIPAYRLPPDVLRADIERIVGSGAEIETNARIESLDRFLEEGFDAVFIAVGAHRGARMGIDGEQNPGVIDALAFLRDVSLGAPPAVGESVVIVGGGNSAVDASRTALRLGARDVTIIYRRTRKEMRAYPEEITEALREGVNIVFLATPHRISAENGRLKMVCLRTEAGSANSAVPPRPIAGSDFNLEAQTVIVAVGQEPVIPSGFTVSFKGRTILTAPDSMATSKPGVFAGADCVTGPSSVIEAIAAGKRAAAAIDRHLGGSGAIEERLTEPEEAMTLAASLYPPRTAVRDEVPLLSVTERFDGFPLVELPLSPEAAAGEADRCLKCDLPIWVEEAKCRSCFVCQLVCSLKFEGAFNPSKAAITILPAMQSGGSADVRIYFEDKCDGCGLCVRYCPFGALMRGAPAGCAAEKQGGNIAV